GGVAGVGVLNLVETYDPRANIWSTGAPMPTARQSLGVGVVHGTLYAVAGYGGPAGTLATNEAFAPAVPVVAFAAAAVPVAIGPLGGNRFAFEIGAVGVPGLPGTNPVVVRLTIGNTTGSAPVDAFFETGDE